MTPLAWKPQYAIRHETIDAQHQNLFALYNAMVVLPPESVDRERLMDDLCEYGLFHFAEEEALMRSENYPKAAFERHCRSHKLFFRTVQRLRSQSAETALAFFREWLVRHILGEDQDIGHFLERPHA